MSVSESVPDIPDDFEYPRGPAKSWSPEREMLSDSESLSLTREREIMDIVLELERDIEETARIVANKVGLDEYIKMFPAHTDGGFEMMRARIRQIRQICNEAIMEF